VKRRVLTITLAIVLALIGTAGVLAYVHGADARALAGQRAVSVLVAQDKIPSGTTAGTALQSGMLVSQKLPASAVPSEAVSSITAAVSGLVMGTEVEPGQVLLRPMLVASSQLTGALAIPQGMVAVTVSTCMPGAVAGYVQPGSHVAVFGTFSDIKNNGSQSCGGSGSSPGSGQTNLAHVHTRILLPRVLVLAVGAATVSGQNGTSSGSTLPNSSSSSSSTSSASSQNAVMVTLAVNQADAERLITLDSSGLTYLALLSPSSVTSFDITLPPLFRP
jgi:pilus assembly protein CpaB